MASNYKSTEELNASESSSIEDIVKEMTDRNKNQRKRMLRSKAFQQTTPSTSSSTSPKDTKIIQVESVDVHTAPKPIPAIRKTITSVKNQSKQHEIVEIFSASDEIEMLTDQPTTMAEQDEISSDDNIMSGDNNKGKMFFARSRKNTVIDIEPLHEEKSECDLSEAAHLNAVGDVPTIGRVHVEGVAQQHEQIVNQFKDRKKMMKKSMEVKNASSSLEQLMIVDERIPHNNKKKKTTTTAAAEKNNLQQMNARGNGGGERKSIQFLKQSKEKALLIKATEPISKARQLLREEAKKLESTLKRSADSNAALKGVKRVSRKTPASISEVEDDEEGEETEIDEDSDTGVQPIQNAQLAVKSLKAGKSQAKKSQQTPADEMEMNELELSNLTTSESMSDDNNSGEDDTTGDSYTVETRSSQSTAISSADSKFYRTKLKQLEKNWPTKIPAKSKKSHKKKPQEFNYSKIIGIYLHETGDMKFKLKYNRLQSPRIKVSVFNKSKGCLLEKSDSTRNVIINYEPSDLEHIQPIISEECRFKTNGALQYSCVWEELLIINDDIKHIQNGNVIVFFELVDLEPVQKLVPSKMPIENASTGWTKLCWAFLKLMGDNEEYTHMETKCKLQLYAYQRVAKKQRLSDSIWNQFTVKQKVKYPSTLSVTVKGITSKPQGTAEALGRPKTALQSERSGTLVLDASTLEEDVSDFIETKIVEDLDGSTKIDVLQEFQRNWIKLPGKSFQCPNKINMSLNIGAKGSMVSKFHPNGNFVAFSSHSETDNSIVVAKMPNMQLKWTLQGHSSIIYDLDWCNSKDNNQFPLILLSASSDHTAIVWIIFKEMYSFQLLPHTSFVYASRFLCGTPFGHKLPLVTGGRDAILRIWNVTIGDKNRLPKLSQQLSGHEEYITAISIHSLTKMFSSDWSGMLIEWCSVNKEFIKTRTTKLNTQILSMMVHERRDRLYTFGTDNQVRVIHLTAFTVVQQIGHQETCHSRTSRKIALSPCGSLLFIPETDGISCWSTSTGMQVNSINLNRTVIQGRNCRSLAFVSSIDYHPHDMLLIVTQYGTKSGITLLGVETNHDLTNGDQSKRVAVLRNECGLEPTTNSSLTQIIKRIDSIFFKEKNQTDDFKHRAMVVSQGIQTSLFSERSNETNADGNEIGVNDETYSISINNFDAPSDNDALSTHTFVIDSDDNQSAISTGTYILEQLIDKKQADKSKKRHRKTETKLTESPKLDETFEIIKPNEADSDDTTTSDQFPQ